MKAGTGRAGLPVRVGADRPRATVAGKRLQERPLLMPDVIILYVEDNGLLRQTVAETLELEGWEVDACEDGLAALRKLESDAPFNLFLFDNELPGHGGLELLRRARMLAHRRLTPAVIISADEIRDEARRAGASVFLKKPDDIGLLVETIAALLCGSASQARTLEP